jgi:hypothetical protein
VRDSHQKIRFGHDFVPLLVEVDIDSRDIGVDDAAFLPNGIIRFGIVDL